MLPVWFTSGTEGQASDGATREDSTGGPRLTLRHLKRAHIDMLCAFEGIEAPAKRADALKALEGHLSAGLLCDWVLTPLSGLVPPCEYPSVVKARPYEILLFGGSQQGIAETSRLRMASGPADALWQCSLLDGEWRAIPTFGNAPAARSGHSAVMYDGKVRTSCLFQHDGPVE
jgi:hypothetical protein